MTQKKREFTPESGSVDTYVNVYFHNINSFVYDYVQINVKRSMRGVDGARCC